MDNGLVLEHGVICNQFGSVVYKPEHDYDMPQKEAIALLKDRVKYLMSPDCVKLHALKWDMKKTARELGMKKLPTIYAHPEPGVGKYLTPLNSYYVGLTNNPANDLFVSKHELYHAFQVHCMSKNLAHPRVPEWILSGAKAPHSFGITYKTLAHEFDANIFAFMDMLKNGYTPSDKKFSMISEIVKCSSALQETPFAQLSRG